MRAEKWSSICPVRATVRRGAVGELGEGTAHDGHQIGWGGKLEDVMPADAAVGKLVGRAQISVGEQEVAGGGGGQHLEGRLLDGRVDAGPVVLRVVILALRPALGGAVGVSGIR